MRRGPKREREPKERNKINSLPTKQTKKKTMTEMKMKMTKVGQKENTKEKQQPQEAI